MRKKRRKLIYISNNPCDFENKCNWFTWNVDEIDSQKGNQNLSSEALSMFFMSNLTGKNTILNKLFNIFPIDKSKLFSSGNFVEQFPWNVIRYQAYAET